MQIQKMVAGDDVLRQMGEDGASAQFVPARREEMVFDLLHSERERLIERLAPLSTFFIMPAFALANTAVPLGGIFGGGAGSTAATVAPARGRGMRLARMRPRRPPRRRPPVRLALSSRTMEAIGAASPTLGKRGMMQPLGRLTS